MEQRILQIIDSQGKDIAVDFSELERKVTDLRELVENGFQETSTALLRLNESVNERGNHKQSASSATYDYIEEQLAVSKIDY